MNIKGFCMLNRLNCEMKLHFTWRLLVLVCGWPAMVGAQVELPGSQEPQRVFAGMAQNISVTFSNPGDENFKANIRIRVFQTSSSTSVPLGDWYWKEFEVLPRQAVLESASLDFPAVNAETRFLVQWMADKNHIIGNTEVLVYPTNLLGELKVMFGGDEMGVLDPNNVLKPIFAQDGLKFLNLEAIALEDFSGKLAIIGPFESKTQWREGFPQAVKRIASKGAAVVWIQPPSNPEDEIKPSFYVVPEGRGAVVIVQPELLSDFSKSPKSQQNLIRFCKLALKPEPFALPDLALQP
jgi:hypothetical protein